MTAERNQYRSEAAEAGRQADKLTQRLSAMPKARLSHSLSLDSWCTDSTQCLFCLRSCLMSGIISDRPGL